MLHRAQDLFMYKLVAAKPLINHYTKLDLGYSHAQT